MVQGHPGARPYARLGGGQTLAGTDETLTLVCRCLGGSCFLPLARLLANPAPLKGNLVGAVGHYGSNYYFELVR